MAKETAKKATAKKAESKNKDAVEELRKAVEAARDAGLVVRANATKEEDGVTTTVNL